MLDEYEVKFAYCSSIDGSDPCSSSLSYTPSLSSSTCTSTMIENPVVDSTLNPPIRRKRKASYHDTSDLDDNTEEDAKSTKTDENKKQNHSEIEKRRRDKMNTYITELSAMIPMCHAMSRKLDKLTVLRMAVQHLKTIRGSVHSYTEGHYKPSFLTDQELKHLILQAADGFLFVVGCDRGRILYISQSVSKILNYSQADLLGQSLFDIIHPKDVAKVKEQLSSSDLNPRERLIDAKTMLPVKTDVPQNDSRLCPGARRSFFCRMKCQTASQIKEEADTTTGCHRKNTKLNSDKKFNVIQCTGYLKSWAPAKIGLEEQEDADSDPCNLSCLVAIGRILPHISTVALSNYGNEKVRPIQFVSRHAVDGKFIFVDQRATLVLGFLPQEMLGTSMYEYFHNDDIPALADRHKMVLQTSEYVSTNVYRFRTKDGDFIRLQSELKSFKNPWTKEIEYVISKNNLVLSEFRMVESSASRPEVNIHETYDFFSSPTGKDIQTLINSHVEASKIGRQIAEQVIDLQRRSVDSCSNSPDPENCLTNLPNGEAQITTSVPMSDRYKPTPPIPDFQNQYANIRTNVPLNTIPADPVLSGPSPTKSSEIIDMIGDVRQSPIQQNNGQPMDGNDEAAMAVIMSLLEADAGLGGPVDFSGLPWPLP
ncbi:protein cycle isoform X2 [Anthonomus grandis grandis]|uniref:protein cycle isoform X2 n=1 Tax=Anthonomus grandis grandis TaxID=2921223 RepID=UPI002165CC40|nr:protein cycle isoform X2 [Anthonomus grandis grandis]